MQFTSKRGIDYYNSDHTNKAPNLHLGGFLDLVKSTNESANKSEAVIVARDGEEASICFFNTLYKPLGLNIDREAYFTKRALHNTYIKTIESLNEMGYKHIYNLSAHINGMYYSQNLTYKSCLNQLNIILNEHSLGNKGIELTYSPFIAIKDVKNTEFHKSYDLVDQLELNFYLVQSKFRFVKKSYLNIMRKMCFEKHEKLQLFVLKKELWGLHVYMAEFYFYIMWKIKKVTEIVFTEPISEKIFIEHLQNETKKINDIITKYITIYQSKKDASTLSDEMKSLINEFRGTIMHYLEDYHSKSVEEAFYYLAFNSKNRAINNPRASADKKDKMFIKKSTQKIKIGDKSISEYCKVHMTVVYEKSSHQNMMFIYAFTFYCTNYPNLSVKSIEGYAKKNRKTFLDAFRSMFIRKEIFQVICFNTVMNICSFIRVIKNTGKIDEKILLMYPKLDFSLAFYINTGNKKCYELKILTFSSMLYFYSEYIRSFMW